MSHGVPQSPSPTSALPSPENPALHPPDEGRLSLWDTISLIVGIVVGVGIYETPPLVFQQLSGTGQALGVWVAGGLLALIGALCYAELASTYPRLGGDYVYLTRAFGTTMGFLFGWAQLAVIITGNIGMMAYVFADYCAALLGDHGKILYAVLPIVGLTAINAAGVVSGKTTQNILTVLKVLGLLGVVTAGLFAGVSSKPPIVDVTRGAGSGSLAVAMILVLLTYGGWNDAAYVAAEVRERRRNIPRALVLGTLAILSIYLVVNSAYVAALGFEGVKQSRAVAADTLHHAWGPAGSQVISVLVMVSALSAINGLIFTGSRLYATLGYDYQAFAWLAHWNSRSASPIRSLVAQAGISVAMVIVLGTATGQFLLDRLFAMLWLEEVNWAGRSGFDTVLRLTAPVFWFFFLMTSLSLFVLRWKDKHAERPFRVPLYPLLPAIFTMTCGYMLYSGIEYAGRLGLVGLALLLLGLPFYLTRRKLA